MIESKLSVQEMKMVVGDLVFGIYEEIFDLSSAGRLVVQERNALKAEVVDLQARLLRRMSETAGGLKDTKDTKDTKDGKDNRDGNANNARPGDAQG